MIKIIQNDTILNSKIENNSIIFSPSNNLLYLKEKLIDKDVSITSLKGYINRLIIKNTKYRLISKEEAFICMADAYKNVKSKLSVYKNIDDLSFINELLKTYDLFYKIEMLKNDKKKDLEYIYKEYESIVESKKLFLDKDLVKYLINNIKLIEYDNIYFENIDELDDAEVCLINELKKSKNVYVYANTINNDYLINMLNKIDDVVYEGINSDVDNLYKIESNDLFDNIDVIGCNDLYEEIKYVSNEIRKDINKGLEYKDILIVSTDVKRYYSYFNMLLDVPYTRLKEEGLLTYNYILLLDKLFNEKDFSCKTFIDMLKLNLFDIDKKNLDMLDNYSYVWDLDDKPFYEEFTLNPSGKYDFKEEDKKNLDTLNDIRLSVLNPIKVLLDNIVNEKDVKEVLKYLFMYLDEEGISKKLSEYDEYGYNRLIDVFEILNDNVKNINIDMLFEYFKNLLNVKETYENTLDNINISDISNYQNKGYKKVYFIGVTEKDVPQKFKYTTLINDEDLSDSTIYDLVVKERDVFRNRISNIFTFNNVLVTYHKLDDGSSKVNMSDILKKFKNIHSFKYDFKKFVGKENNLKISKDAVNNIYENSLNLNPSSIEMFSRCRYSYFLKYGLKLNVKEKYTFDNRDVGTFVHYVLENCIKDKVEKDDIDSFVDKYTKEYFKSHLNNYDNVSYYVINKLNKSTKILLNIIISELENTKFETKYTEFNIKNTPLKIEVNNKEFVLSGIIDRVDTYEDNNNYYFRIIDYKTGSKKFRLDDVMIGLNMQMIIYLIALKLSKITDKKIIPTGFLYYPALIHFNKESIDTPFDKVYENILKNTRMNGILNSDNLNLYNEDSYKYIDVKTRNNFNDNVLLNTKELEKVLETVISVLKDEVKGILDGDIKINPIKDSKNDSCKYCLFSSICKFNDNIDEVREYKKYTNREVLDRIEGDYHGMD